MTIVNTYVKPVADFAKNGTELLYVLTQDDMSPVGAFPYNTCLVEIKKK